MADDESLRVLVVEDEAILALEIELILRELGHHVVGVAMDAARASALASSEPIDLALIDINLRDGPTGPDIAHQLVRDQGAAVIFLTANPEQIPEGFAGALGAMSKPFDDRSIAAVVEFARRFIRERSVPPVPRRFRLAPWLSTPPSEIKPQ
jgi:CheY-like chemotaxis protein